MRHLDRELQEVLEGGIRDPGRNDLDQYLQAAEHLDTLRRLQGKWGRTGEGHRGHAPISAVEEHISWPVIKDRPFARVADKAILATYWLGARQSVPYRW